MYFQKNFQCFTVGLAVTALAFFCLASVAQLKVDEKSDTFENANLAAAGSKNLSEQTILGLKPGKGRDLVLANCIGCHSTRLIVSHRLNRKRWEETITTMKQHGLWTLPPQWKDQILNYLETNQGPLQDGDQKITPWALPLYRPNPLWK